MMALMVNVSTFAQGPLPVVCGMEEGGGTETEPENFNIAVQTCLANHSTNSIFTDLNRFTPHATSRKIRVRANFIILQKADGTGNFQDIPEHRAFLNDWLNRCNFRFGSLWGSYGAGACTDYVTDSKIEIIPNWVFLPDPIEYYWDNTNNPGTQDCPNTSSWWLNGLDAQINSNPNIPRGINVYLTSHGPIHHQMITLGTINNPEQAGMPYTWCSELPSRTNLSKASRIHIPNLYLKYWWFQNHPNVIGQPFSVSRAWLVDEGISLAHEFGHSFIQEYVHTCPCPNHLMGANCGFGAVLRRIDMQYMHRGFTFNNIRQFIDCDEKYNIQDGSEETPYQWVTQDETWNLDMRLYNNVRVKSGATLTITCRVLLPENAHIRVEQGAKIVIDGGHLYRANTCSPQQFWAGIYANGNSFQPQPDPYGPLIPDKGAIVILKGDGLIEGAAIGVSTKNSPQWDTPQHRGAIIDAENFTFRDCRKGVEFMKYDFPNFSRFDNIVFTRTASGSMYNGVSMWATNGVRFEGCNFLSMTKQGIISWDASYTVTKENLFTGSPIGILAGGSMPLAGIIEIGQSGTGMQDRNRFIKNTVGIRGTSNTQFRIIGNYFEDYDFDIAMAGNSNNEIWSNRFEGGAAGIQLDNTGEFKNDLFCNVYSGNIVGVNLVENNWGFNFRNEDFTVAFHDLFIEGTGANPGIIQQFQGNPGTARFNYFSAGRPENIKTSTVWPNNVTIPFNYFHPDAASIPRLKPKCALNDPSCSVPSNFFLYQTTGQETMCPVTPAPNEQFCKTRPCLENIRIEILQTRNTLNQQYTAGLEAKLQELIAAREASVEYLAGELVRNRDWPSVEALLEGDLNQFNRRRLVAVAMLKSEWQKADSLLQHFPLIETADQYFVQVQQINKDRLSNPAFSLSESGKQALKNIATSGSTESGSAQTLLSLLADEIVMPRLPQLESGNNYSMPGGMPTTAHVEALTVAPNPSNDHFNVLFSLSELVLTTTASLRLELVHAVSGQVVMQHPVTANEMLTIPISGKPDGMYILLIKDVETGKVRSTQKVVIQH